MTQDTIVDLYNQITGAAYLVMIVISSIGLLVGGIGVMNIMLVSVKERTREIGIRKAIGARSGDILKQFLIEAIFLTGTGGIIGVLVGFGIALIVKAATPLPAAVSPWSVVLGLAVSAAIGLFFGIFPAQKAARMDPIVAPLRITRATGIPRSALSRISPLPPPAGSGLLGATRRNRGWHSKPRFCEISKKGVLRCSQSPPSTPPVLMVASKTPLPAGPDSRLMRGMPRSRRGWGRRAGRRAA